MAGELDVEQSVAREMIDQGIVSEAEAPFLPSQWGEVGGGAGRHDPTEDKATLKSR